MSGTRSIRRFLSLTFAAYAALGAAQAWGQAAAPAQAPLPDGFMRPPAVKAGLAPNMRATETTTTAHVFDVAFTTGDEILSGLTDLARKHNITSGYITGLGGLSSALLGFGSTTPGVFHRIAVDEKSELVALSGHIASRDGVPTVHLHAVVALQDGSTRAGHVFEMHVAPLGEISVVATSIGGAGH
jgi:predicted DNA-binding protein with PD1-like motif